MQFTTDNFETEVLQNNLPVVVDFYADWCGPCKMLSPIIESLEPQYAGKVVIGKLNVDDHPQIAARYGVMSIPTLIAFQGGEVVWTSVGLLPANAIEEKLSSLVS